MGLLSVLGAALTGGRSLGREDEGTTSATLVSSTGEGVLGESPWNFCFFFDLFLWEKFLNKAASMSSISAELVMGGRGADGVGLLMVD